MTRKNAQKIGEKAGRVLELIDPESSEASPEILEIKIQVDSRDPILPCFNYMNNKGEEVWALVGYKRLPEMCFKCGIISHTISKYQFPKHHKAYNYGPHMNLSLQSFQSREYDNWQDPSQRYSAPNRQGRW